MLDPLLTVFFTEKSLKKYEQFTLNVFGMFFKTQIKLILNSPLGKTPKPKEKSFGFGENLKINPRKRIQKQVVFRSW